MKRQVVKNKRNGIKFQFDTEFQENILRFTVNDNKGYQAINLYDDYYFDLIEHQVITDGIKSFCRRKKKIPSKVMLKEELRKLYLKKEYKEGLTGDDKILIDRTINKLYRTPAKDGDSILEEIIKFAQYVNMKSHVEDVDIYDYNSYERFSKNIQKALNIGLELNESAGTFLIEGIQKRLWDRKNRENIHPFPFWQMNKFTNANGYYKGSVFVILDKAKAFKTGFLVNLIRGYMRMRKKVIVFDLENGEDSLSMRFEQSLLRKNKKQLLSGEYDNALMKIARKYKRLGVEVVIKRLPAGSTTADMQYWMDFYYKEQGLKFDYAAIDYIGLMGSLKKDEDDTNRISNAYVDVKNFAEKNNLIHVWTGHHVVRGAYKRRSTKYTPDDTAKCIDIHRHVDGMFSIQQNDIEKEGNVYRLEVLDQRDGPPEGAMYFFVNEEHQRADEFTKKQLEVYLKELRGTDDMHGEGTIPKNKQESHV